MNTARYCLTLVLLSIFSLYVSADLIINLNTGHNKWGYSATHATATQQWNGKPFVMETRMARPSVGTTGFLPRETWFGLYVEDTRNGTRFSFGPFNPSWENNPKEVPYAAVSYLKKGNFTVIRSNLNWICSEQNLFLKADFDGESIRYSISKDGTEYKEALCLIPEKPFSPNLVGITLDSFHSTPCKNLVVKEFRITGDGPAQSDCFDGNKSALWKHSETSRAIFLHPVELEMKWERPASGNNVFDRGQNAEFAFSCRTTELVNHPIEFQIHCQDREGNELWSDSQRFTLTEKPLLLRGHVPAEKINKNGVYQLCIKAVNQGKNLGSIMQQFAVIPASIVTPGKYDRKSPYSGNYFADWNLAARLGIRKVRQTWYDSREFEKQRYAERARANGLLINGPCLNVGFNPQTPAKLQEKAQWITNELLKLEKNYSDFIYCQEIYNEPENWPPTALETDLIPFAALIAQVRQNLRAAKSNLLLMTPGVTHVNLSFLKKMAIVGGSDIADIIAVHGYRSPCRPEFGHEEDVAAIKELFGDKPIYVNEDAYFALTQKKSEEKTSITQPFHTMIELDELTHAVYLQRKYLCQFMAGYALVNQFDSIQNHSLSETEFHRRPALVTLAALTSMLPHPEFIRRNTNPTDHLWITEWVSDEKTFTILWSLNGFHEVQLESSEPMLARDCFGNDITSGKQLFLIVGGAPIFVLGKKISLIRRELTTNHPVIILPEENPLGGKPFDMEIVGRARNMTQSEITVKLCNNSGREFEGIATPHFMNDAPASWYFEPTSCPVKLSPGEKITLVFVPKGRVTGEPFDPYHPVPGKGYNALWWTEGYRIAIELSNTDGTMTTLHSRRPLCLRGIPYLKNVKIDADLSEWKNVPEFSQIGGSSKRNTALARFWTGAADYLPTFKFAWNRQGLLFCAEILDDKHDIECKGQAAWRSDSIQLGLNPHHERPDFTNYLVLTLADGNPAILQRATQKRAAGPISEIPIKILRYKGDYNQPGRTLYECLIPWELLDFDPSKGFPLGFCVQFNESDGWWRRGWEGYFLQMGGQIVDPRYFGDLTPVY